MARKTLYKFVLSHPLFAQACDRYGIPRFFYWQPEIPTQRLADAFISGMQAAILIKEGYDLGFYGGGSEFDSQFYAALWNCAKDGYISPSAIDTHYHSKDKSTLDIMTQEYMALYIRMPIPS